MKNLDDKDFLILPSLNIILRFFVSAILISFAYYLQLLNNTFTIILSFIVLLFFIIFNWVRRVKVEKDFRSNSKKWQQTNMDEFKQALKKIKKIDHFSTKPGSGFSYFFIVFFIIIFALTGNVSPIYFYLLIDVLVIIGVVIASGNRYIWTPHGLKQKLKLLMDVYNYLYKFYKDRFVIVPHFYVEEKDKKYIPHDAKLMLTPKEQISGFLGIQISVSINSVQEKTYPYLYTVIIAKEEFDLINKFNSIKENSYIKDNTTLIFQRKKQPDDIEIIVIRQKTTISKGYYTNKKAVLNIINTTIAIAKDLFSL